MKKLLFLSLILLFTTFAGFSQTIPPPYINYQAVLYDVNGTNPNAVLANQSFSTFVNIQDELGNLLYKEEHYASTDANGQITVKIGDGVYLQGTITNFNQINWGTGKYYLIVDFDINGTISSTAPEQLVTVPYSFYAGKAGNGMTAVADNGNGTLTFTYANGQTYITPTLSGIQGPIGPAGPQGVPGPQGVAGTNGLNALIKTTTELAGSNCANGGTKIETGLDANGNGVLDAGEVNTSQTQFVCNGVGNTTSGGMHIFLTDGSFTVPIGVTTILVEVWGAGGGGGNGGNGTCGSCGWTSGGGGGGSGGYKKRILNVTPGQIITYSIGIGGGPLLAGGSSSFGGIIANGGQPGVNGSGPYTSGGVGGAGGTGGSGGNNGSNGANVTDKGGSGGSGGNAAQGIGFGGIGGAQQNNNYANGYNGSVGERASGGGGGSGVRNGKDASGNFGIGGLGSTGGDGLIIISY